MSFFNKREVRVPFGREIFLSALGGWEGGLATTTAIVAGLFISTHDRELVINTALIAFMVQAFNGAIGRFSSERTTDEIEHSETVSGYRKPMIDAFAQMLTHVISSLIIIAPIVFVANDVRALSISIVLCLVLMFLIGAIKAKIVKNEILSDGIELVILGSLIISVGIGAGLIIN